MNASARSRRGTVASASAPMKTCLAAVAIVWVVMLLTACANLQEGKNDYADWALSSEERFHLKRLQALFADRRVRVGNSYLASDTCKVYRSREEHGAIVAWELVDLPRGGYPAFLAGCGGMSMDPGVDEDGYLYFRLCEMAIGAGGGCQRGGHYRTRDGVTWECEGANARSWTTCSVVAEPGSTSETKRRPVPLTPSTSLPAESAWPGRIQGSQ